MKENIEEDIEDIIDDIGRVACVEIKPKNVININAPSNLIYNLIKSDIREELRLIKRIYKKQIPILIENARDNLTEEKFKKKILKTDFYFQNSNKSREFEEDLYNYYDALSNGLSILLEIDNKNIDSLWSFNEEYKEIDIFEILLCRGDIYMDHKNEIELNMTLNNSIIPIKSIEYSNEGVRVFKKSEKIIKTRYNKDL